MFRLLAIWFVNLNAPSKLKTKYSLIKQYIFDFCWFAIIFSFENILLQNMDVGKHTLLFLPTGNRFLSFA